MWRFEILVQGFPGRTTRHGGLAWSTVGLLSDGARAVLVDTGAYTYRNILRDRLGERGLRPMDITDILVTHCHWDHLCNYPLFPRATVHVPGLDLDWALAQPVGTWEVPELHVKALAKEPRARRIEPGGEPLPGVRSVATPGHTPGHLAYVASTDGGEIVLAGDAVKHRAELLSGRAEMSLDAEASRRSILLLRTITRADPRNTLVCGHDRPLRMESGGATYVGALDAGITARLSDDFDHVTTFDLARMAERATADQKVSSSRL